MELIVTVFASAGVSAALVCGILWVTKKWISERLRAAIQYEYDQKLENHKALLNYRTNEIVEKLRADLHVQAITHQIRYSKLHEERAQIIRLLYQKLEKLSVAVRDLVCPLELIGEKPIPEKDNEAVVAGQNCDTFYRENKIFLSAETCTLLEEILKLLSSGRHWFMAGYKEGQSPVSSQAAQEFSQWRMTAWKSVDEKVPILKEKIAREFRDILGA